LSPDARLLSWIIKLTPTAAAAAAAAGEEGAKSAEPVVKIINNYFSIGVVAKIAHAPTLALKDASGTDRGQRLSEATRNLFDL
jgi:hypothetical protein